jgi:hypothetical protein
VNGITYDEPVFVRLYNEARGCHDWEAVTALEAIDRQLRYAREDAREYCRKWESTAEYRAEKAASAEAAAAMRTRPSDHRAPPESDG